MGLCRNTPAGPSKTGLALLLEDKPCSKRQPGCCAAHTAQPLQAASPGIPTLLPGAEDKSFFTLVLPRAAGLSQSVKPSVCLSAFLQLLWNLFVFPPISEPFCRCHITISNIQLHLSPNWLQRETEKGLTSQCWDSTHHSSPRARDPQINPLEHFSLLAPFILTGSAEHRDTK